MLQTACNAATGHTHLGTDTIEQRLTEVCSGSLRSIQPGNLSYCFTKLLCSTPRLLSVWSCAAATKHKVHVLWWFWRPRERMVNSPMTPSRLLEKLESAHCLSASFSTFQPVLSLPLIVPTSECQKNRLCSRRWSTKWWYRIKYRICSGSAPRAPLLLFRCSPARKHSYTWIKRNCRKNSL